MPEENVVKKDNQSLNPEAVKAMIADHKNWYHRIEVMPGVVTPGIHDSTTALNHLDQLGLPRNCSGLRVLDIGCRDGFFSFEMERRGAEVVGMDYVNPTNTGFSLASKLLGSKVNYLIENVNNISGCAGKIGSCDIVLFLGVLYHLRNPLAALDEIHSVTKPGTLLFLETQLLDRAFMLGDGSFTSLEELSPQLSEVPIMQFYPRDALSGDATSKWAPNMTGLKRMLEEAQFEVLDSKIYSSRGYVKAKAVNDPYLEQFRQMDSGSGFDW